MMVPGCTFKFAWGNVDRDINPGLSFSSAAALVRDLASAKAVAKVELMRPLNAKDNSRKLFLVCKRNTYSYIYMHTRVHTHATF